jgi:hypothetical protein
MIPEKSRRLCRNATSSDVNAIARTLYPQTRCPDSNLAMLISIGSPSKSGTLETRPANFVTFVFFVVAVSSNGE